MKRYTKSTTGQVYFLILTAICCKSRSVNHLTCAIKWAFRTGTTEWMER